MDLLVKGTMPFLIAGEAPGASTPPPLQMNKPMHEQYNGHPIWQRNVKDMEQQKFDNEDKSSDLSVLHA